jgi:hypothetical protein
MSFARRMTSERGSALPVVVGVMLIIGILVSVIHQTSNRVAQTTTRERAEKRAFQAAEGGLHVANYRLNKMRPRRDECLTTQPTAAGGSSPCPATSWQNMGSGASYRYTVTRVLSAGSSECDLPTGLNYFDNDYRCITSVGTAGSQTRRVQAVVQVPRVAGMFEVEGLFGHGTVTSAQNLVANGEMASNTRVTLGSYSAPGPRIRLGGGATTTHPGLVTETRSAFETPTYDDRFEYVENTNNNNLLPTVGDPRLLSGRMFVGGSAFTYTIPAGTYSFCNVDFANAATLRVNGPGRAHIFIDSPTRPGSSCASGGNFTAHNSFDVVASDPGLVRIEMYDGTFEMKNSLTFTGTLYAPNTDVIFRNNATLTGAMVADTIQIMNNLTLTGQIPADLRLTAVRYSSGGWLECVRTPSGSSAGSGC